MNKSDTPIKPQDSSLAAKILNAMAGSINAQMTAFSSWMVAGFGAMLGLLVANIDTVSPFIAPTVVGASVKLFLVALVLNVLQRYLAAMVAGSIAVANEVQLIPINHEADLGYIVREIERATFWPTRILVRWSNRKALSGDLAVSGRLNARLAQVQGWLVLAQMIVVVSSTVLIANGLKG